MLAILSPAKDMKLNLVAHCDSNKPEFVSKASSLARELRKYKVEDLSELMKISSKLAQLNVDRYKLWNKEHGADNSGQALFSFTGEAYRGLDANSLPEDAVHLSSKNLRILSGLYGVLNPLDLIHEYRLEMGTKLKFKGYKNLYEFWGTQIKKSIEKSVATSEGDKVLINLASNEYSKSVQLKQLKYPVINPIFKNETNGKLKVVAVYAKKARGMMTRFMLENNIKNTEDLKAFDSEGYYYNSQLSNGSDWVFTR